MSYKLTLEDIGKMAGVSRATVSRVINNTGNVDPELRKRVEKVVAETGYRPNLVARSLASNRTNIIGLIIPSVVRTVFTDPYFPELIQGISKACNNQNYTLSLFLFHSPEEQEQVFHRAIGSGFFDGLIVHERMKSTFIDELTARNIPFVYSGRPPDIGESSYVDVDNVTGAVSAVRHLIRLGHQKIAHIAAPLDTTAGIDRNQGYQKALTEANLPIAEDLVVTGNLTVDGGYVAMRNLLKHQPEALFVASDTMAMGAIEAIHEAGLKIPDDIAVVGFDDLPPATSSNPPLTTVRQFIPLMGQTTVETLIDIVENGNQPPRRVVLPTELIIRGSCGAIPRQIA